MSELCPLPRVWSDSQFGAATAAFDPGTDMPLRPAGYLNSERTGRGFKALSIPGLER